MASKAWPEPPAPREQASERLALDPFAEPIRATNLRSLAVSIEITNVAAREIVEDGGASEPLAPTQDPNPPAELEPGDVERLGEVLEADVLDVDSIDELEAEVLEMLGAQPEPTSPLERLAELMATPEVGEFLGLLTVMRGELV